jgi:hypothetical protein
MPIAGPEGKIGSHDAQNNNLGGLRLRNEETNEIILIPTPTNDPNDPLNWYVLVQHLRIS